MFYYSLNNIPGEIRMVIITIYTSIITIFTLNMERYIGLFKLKYKSVNGRVIQVIYTCTKTLARA